MEFLHTISGKVVLYSTVAINATVVHPLAGVAFGKVLGFVLFYELVAKISGL